MDTKTLIELARNRDIKTFKEMLEESLNERVATVLEDIAESYDDLEEEVVTEADDKDCDDSDADDKDADDKDGDDSDGDDSDADDDSGDED